MPEFVFYAGESPDRFRCFKLFFLSCCFFLTLFPSCYALESVPLPLNTPAPRENRPSLIKAGCILDMSGCNKEEGKAAYDAVSAAVKSINSMGGISGRRLKVMVTDTACQPGRLLQGGAELVSGENLLFLMGPTNPYFINRLAGFAAAEKIPLFVITGSRSMVKLRGIKYVDWVFSAVVDLAVSFRAILNSCRKQGIKRLGILVEATRRGRDAMLLLRGYSKEYGVRIVGVQKFSRGDADMMLQFRELKKSGADRVLVYGGGNDMPAIAESAMFASMPVAVPVQMLNAGFIENVHPSLNLWTAMPPVAAVNFLKPSHPCAFAVQRFYLNMPEGYMSKSIEEKLAAGAVWDAAQLAVQALSHVEGILSRSLLRDSLEELEGGYRGVSGFFHPDKRDHSGLDPDSLIVLEMSGGKWRTPASR